MSDVQMPTSALGGMRTWKHPSGAYGQGPLPEGPWNDEPDKAHWVDKKTDLDCLIHRGPSGVLCGYVGVPPGHPAYGTDYGEIDVAVHGGLTYADRCQESDDESLGICHVPLPGRSDDVWWFGFDCAHAYDEMPRYGMSGLGEYRDFAYVREQVEKLARQLKEMT